MAKEKKFEVKKTLVNGNEIPVVKRPRIAVQFDIDYNGTWNEVSDKGSETVPDLNLTVRQLLANHARGLDNNKHHKDPLYFDIKIPKITDITDVQEYRKYLNEQIKSVNEFIKNEKDEAESKRKSKSNPKNNKVDISEENNEEEEK